MTEYQRKTIEKFFDMIVEMTLDNGSDLLETVVIKDEGLAKRLQEVGASVSDLMDYIDKRS